MLGAVKAEFMVRKIMQCIATRELTPSQLLLTSPRNSVVAHIYFIEILECSRLLVADMHLRTFSTLVNNHGIEVIKTPSLKHICETESPHLPYTKTFEVARQESLIPLATLGSTCLPKPRIISHDFVAAYLELTRLPPPPGIELRDPLLQGNRLLFILLCEEERQ